MHSSPHPSAGWPTKSAKDLKWALKLLELSARDALDGMALLVYQRVDNRLEDFFDQFHARLEPEMSRLEIDLSELGLITPTVLRAILRVMQVGDGRGL